MIAAAGLLIFDNQTSRAADISDPYLNLLMQKGIITQEEARKAQAEVEARRTNLVNELPPMKSKWIVGDAIKDIRLFGDVRLRYEHREVTTPGDGYVRMDRGRYSIRAGLRGTAFDDIYFGIRVDTSANPRSAWLTFGTSSSGNPYQGPYGKSTAGLGIGQAYLGWRPKDWVDVTLGKMANPLYTTSMVWDGDLNPEGAAERFKTTVGEADFFATFGQFIYQDVNPVDTSGGLGFNGLQGNSAATIVQLAWQAGMNYRITTNTSAKMAATIYQYMGLRPTFYSPYYGDTFVGEGAYTGPGSANPFNGASGYGTSGNLLSYPSLGFPNNQVGLNNLLVLEVPFEVDFKFSDLDARLFGDVAYNLEGKDRAEAAARGYAAYLANQPQAPTIAAFKPQTDDVKAYQIGFAVASKDGLGLTGGGVSRRHAWEFRTFWQHVEQYALDPNLLDSDFFEGRANLEGFYATVAYGITDNLTGTARYGYARRNNDKLGTGGSNQDIPQVNPIERFNLLQVDLSLKF